MSKVLGVKVEDELYDRFAALEGSISGNLRIAVEMFLNYHTDKSLTTVNRLLFDEKYKELTKLIDEHLARENKDSGGV